MSVLQEILEWSVSRHVWQQDALRRLVVNGELTEGDVVELARICKAQHGLDDPDTPAPEPIPLEPEHLPSSGDNAPSVRLLSIEDVSNVNALAEGQCLTFAPTGMTIVYGDNGSGKSGYARILRHVCRARARGETILPNVFKDTAPGPAMATIKYQVGDAVQTARWQAGQSSASELAAVSFFDSACASIHVREANDLLFTPFGLDLLPKLVSVCRQINSSLTLECEQLERAKPGSLREPQAKERTEVRSRLDTLIATSADIADFQRLATLAVAEEARILELREELADDPEATARGLRVRHGRVHRLAEEIAQAAIALGDVAVARIRGYLEEAVAKENAARLAAREAFGDQPLPNVGSTVWRALWESARRYSETEAYPDRLFPATDDDTRCVLCQQTLSGDAAKRLQRFEKFIGDDIQQRSLDARQVLTNALHTISALRLRHHDYGDSVNDVKLENEQLAGQLRRFIVQARLRRRQILLSCARGVWSEPLTLPEAFASAAMTMSQEMLSRTQRLELAATSRERGSLQSELDELLARQWLSSVLDDVRTEIGRQQKLGKLASANRDTATSRITLKNGELTHQYVTNALCKGFACEAAKLGAGHLQVQLEPAGGQYGAMQFHIRLHGTGQPADVASVLSEGEFRGIALAGFLAELATSDSASGLVFDDPVCSLDHRWRRLIAERLVKEAQKRQVIVFTHDVVFLVDLADFCKQHRVSLSQSCLRRDHRGSGVCMDGVPWTAMPVKRRIGVLNDRLQRARTVFGRHEYDTYETLAIDICRLLRDTWERGVEELLLGKVVERYRKSVQTGQLAALMDITETDVSSVEEGMTKSSRFLHDQAPAINEPVPEPDELQSDIQALNDWVLALHKRR